MNHTKGEAVHFTEDGTIGTILIGEKLDPLAQSQPVAHRDIVKAIAVRQANAARLARGWNLLNRLDEMGITADEAVERLREARKV